MYKTIVVGTDGSERSAVAVGHAIAIAKANGAKLHVVHAHRFAPQAGSGTQFASAAISESVVSYDRGDEICQRVLLEARDLGVDGEMYSIRGDPADAITEVAQKTGADLVVVGNQGMDGMKRFVLGNVPNKISHHCPCSLLIVDTRDPTS